MAKRRRREVDRIYDQGGVIPYMPLIEPWTGDPDEDPGTPIILGYEDLLPQMFNISPDDSHIRVIRPRVSADEQYLSNLRDNGALPAGCACRIFRFGRTDGEVHPKLGRLR